jgi:hypothetical protein
MFCQSSCCHPHSCSKNSKCMHKVSFYEIKRLIDTIYSRRNLRPQRRFSSLSEPQKLTHLYDIEFRNQKGGWFSFRNSEAYHFQHSCKVNKVMATQVILSMSCSENSIITPLCQYWPNQNEHNKNGCSHNLASLSLTKCIYHSKIYLTIIFIMNGSDYMPITPNDNICSHHRSRSVCNNLVKNFCQTTYMQICVLSFSHNSGTNRKTQSWCQFSTQKNIA